ncbi:ThuA domain-containing protein [Novipirellula artificiosorum]|uniref:Trehalose utilization n=1 Tax=Novipirellula artificiosorum TaxID=2528016 RepID=A0A5C6E3X1_9BACT|nr:ThuA domain-containing protein [Novipirellula artificiosorum]TWU41909.1 Trehalose utilization [Novipirellula artificiosorum]
MKRTLLATFILAVVSSVMAADYTVAPQVRGEIRPPDQQWQRKIESLAPKKPTAQPEGPRKVLVFSLSTGYKHQVAPHVSAIIKILGIKTGAFEVTSSDDVEVFTEERLEGFDAIVLNNVCPTGPGRDLFVDVLNDPDRARELEANLLKCVEKGTGLVAIHGSIAFQNNSTAVSDMLGGSFDFHPKRQGVTLDLVEPSHPLVAAFEGKGFLHEDEPYLFKNAYKQKNFRPLLEMDVSKLDEKTRSNPSVVSDVRYVAWVKRHGKGRVFYCGPSHQPESYETTAMLRFLLDGIQYALGDLRCDDSPTTNRNPIAEKAK